MDLLQNARQWLADNYDGCESERNLWLSNASVETTGRALRGWRRRVPLDGYVTAEYFDPICAEVLRPLEFSEDKARDAADALASMGFCLFEENGRVVTGIELTDHKLDGFLEEFGCDNMNDKESGG